MDLTEEQWREKIAVCYAEEFLDGAPESPTDDANASRALLDANGATPRQEADVEASARRAAQWLNGGESL